MPMLDVVANNYVAGGDARKGGSVDNHVFTGLERHIDVKQDDPVVSVGAVLVETMDLYLRRDVRGSGEDAGEIIRCIFRQGNGRHRDEEHLGLPAVGCRGRKGPCILGARLLESGIRDLGPARGIVIAEGQPAVGVRALPEVGVAVVLVLPRAVGRSVVAAGKDGAVIDRMVLEDDAAGGDLGVVRVAAPVEDDPDIVRVDAIEGALPEDDVFTGLEGDVRVYEHDPVVGIGPVFIKAMDLDLDGHVSGGAEDAGEVILHRGAQGDGRRGNEEHLGLPAVGRCGREGPGIFGTGLLEDRIRNLGPAWSIVIAEGQSAVGVRGFPEVGFRRIVESVEHGGGRLGGQGEVPGDLAVVADQVERIVVSALDPETRILHEVGVRDIRETGSGREDQEEVVSGDLEGIGRLLRVYRNGIVLAVVGVERAVRGGGHAGVDIQGSALARIEGIAVLVRESHAVVIKTDGGLLVRGGRPPFRTGRAGRAATEMCGDGVVDAPLLGRGSRQEADVPVEIDDGVVHVESLFHIVGRDAGRIHDLQADLVVPGGGEDLRQAVLGRIGREFAVLVLQDPDRDDPLRPGREGEGDLVGLLVDGNDRFEAGRKRGVRLGRMVDFLDRAGENQNGNT